MTALCTVSYCPAKRDPDWHHCWVCQNPAIEHHHVKSRGSGGSKKRENDPLNVVALCHRHHEMVTLHECSDDILDINGALTYVYFDLHGNTLIERPVGSAGAEAPLVVERAAVHATPLASAPPAGEKEEGDGQAPSPSHSRDRRRDSVPFGARSQSNLAAPLTHEQRVAIAQEIKDTEWHRQWKAGDTANQWRAEMGEEAEQYLDDFGYVQESLANIMRVCAAIPKEIRNSGLRFSHHVVVASKNREDMDELLTECWVQELSVAEFRRQVHGVKPKTKRYSLEELRELMMVAFSDAAFSGTSSVEAFLDWIESRGD